MRKCFALACALLALLGPVAMASSSRAQDGEADGPLKTFRDLFAPFRQDQSPAPAPDAGPATEPSTAPQAPPAEPPTGSVAPVAGPAAQPAEALAPELPAADPAAGDGVERASQPAPAAPPPLRFAVLAGGDAGRTLRVLAPVTAGLSDALGQPVEFIPAATYGAMIAAATDGRVDGAFFSTTAFSIAEARCSCLRPLVAAAAEDGSLAFEAQVLVRADSGISAVADLKGRRIAAAASDSVGGRLVQTAGLVRDGFDPARDAELVDSGSPANAVLDMLDGEADAALAWASVGSGEGDAAAASRGPMAALLAAGDVGEGEVATLWRSPPIMHGPFAVSGRMGTDAQARIASYLIGLDRAAPAAYDLLNPYYGGGYQAVDAEDYKGAALLAGYAP